MIATNIPKFVKRSLYPLTYCVFSCVVFKAQWQIICFDKNNKQDSKMVLRAEAEIGKEG